MLPAIFCSIFGITQLLSFIELEENSSNSKSEIQNEKNQVVKDGWQTVLICLSIVTLSGGFIFGSMTFLIPRLFEINLSEISNDIAITGILAGLVYAFASFAQIGTGWLADKIPPKYVLSAMGVGQLIFIYLASFTFDYSLLFIMLAGMLFVFGQVPITDIILVKYVQDSWRGRVLSIKFMVNLCAGAAVLPAISILLKNGFDFSHVLKSLAIISIAVIVSGMLLPNKSSNFIIAKQKSL